ncbi:CRISPR system precrRNA processing endoribonuclease RAMP protein Cas6 [Helicobacter sp. 23-1044]
MIDFCKISILSRDEFIPPFFIGSQIRGALGYALKSVVCTKDDGKCESCQSAESCAFFDFYERKNTYHNFCLDFKLGAPRYDFNIYLFESAIQNAPVILASLHKMLCEIGLNINGAREIFKDIVIFVNDKFCFCNDDIKMPLDFRTQLNIDNFTPRAKITFTTPLRIKKNNIFVRDNALSLHDIFSSLHKRKLAIFGKNSESLHESSAKLISINLKYTELYRKSRHHNTMNLGGLMGDILIDSLDKQSYTLLKIGELIGLGKQCSFGLGRFTLQPY